MNKQMTIDPKTNANQNELNIEGTNIGMNHYHDGVTKQVVEVISEGTHEVSIALHRCPSLKNWKGITPK